MPIYKINFSLIKLSHRKSINIFGKKEILKRFSINKNIQQLMNNKILYYKYIYWVMNDSEK